MKVEALTLLVGLSAVAYAGCGSFVPQPRDPAGAYLAVLTAPGLLGTGRGVVLGTQLMSDAGTYEASGPLDSTVIQRLTHAGIVQEVCVQTFRRGEVPPCAARQASNGLRLSRLLPVDDSTYAIFIGQGNLQLPGDPFHIPFGTTHRCQVSLQDSVWVRGECTLHMIT
jgi:hypothetical protein